MAASSLHKIVLVGCLTTSAAVGTAGGQTPAAGEHCEIQSIGGNASTHDEIGLMQLRHALLHQDRDQHQQHFQTEHLPIGCAPAPPDTDERLDPAKIPKFVELLVIPGVMRSSGAEAKDHRRPFGGSQTYRTSSSSEADGASADKHHGKSYKIAVRQFKQQILPSCLGLTTTVWGFGPESDPEPTSGVAPAPNSQFNYPAYTLEAVENVETRVEWVNDLVQEPWSCRGNANDHTDDTCKYLPHLFAVDRSLHWANPEQLPCHALGKTTDCRPDPMINTCTLQEPYTGPVPWVTHLHGGHSEPESDGYPEAWTLPDASNIPASYAKVGRLTNQYGPGRQTNTRAGRSSYRYKNDQPSATLWFHDHTLGMTRNNVYAGAVGFYIIRSKCGGEAGLKKGQKLPGPAPKAGESFEATNGPQGRRKYREFPVVIQDKSFRTDGSLFYPSERRFFEGVDELNIAYTGDTKVPSDIPRIWNPEAFFDVMVVNGKSWPKHEVEPDLYRLRLLNGCNSRFLNLALFVYTGHEGYEDAADADTLGSELPFYQIGSDQGLLPKVVKVMTGTKFKLPGGGQPQTQSAVVPDAEALLLAPAERADVLIDFRHLREGTQVLMINTAPDEPFVGFDVTPPLKPANGKTTGLVMKFVVRANTAAGDDATAPEDLILHVPVHLPKPILPVRKHALLEVSSQEVCTTGEDPIAQKAHARPDPATAKSEKPTCVKREDPPVVVRDAVPFGPQAMLLGIDGSAPFGGEPKPWGAPITTTVRLGDTEDWELWNWSRDAHPIHLHQVKFQIIGRHGFDNVAKLVSPNEEGWKDTVIAYPGQVTVIRAKFDLAGLYVWHCHILEHEDNEMMLPFCVEGPPGKNAGPGCATASTKCRD